eukprot:5396911-Pleurochrysis_carterae.AAC.1
MACPMRQPKVIKFRTLRPPDLPGSGSSTSTIMVAITDLGERSRLTTTIPGSHLRVFKISPIVLEMLLRGSFDVLRGSPATLRDSLATLWGSPATLRGLPV